MDPEQDVCVGVARSSFVPFSPRHLINKQIATFINIFILNKKSSISPFDYCTMRARGSLKCTNRQISIYIGFPVRTRAAERDREQ